MAQKTDIRLRRSDTAGKIPTSANLSDGELAINTGSGALYFKKSDGTIITAHDNTILHIDSDTTGSSTTGTNPKVGIGTTSPEEDLHVVGDIKLTGTLFNGTRDEYSNSNLIRLNQRYTGGAVSGTSYFEQNEYQKVVTITPNGSSENYQVSGTYYVQSGGSIQEVHFVAGLRSGVLPDLTWSIYYDQSNNGTAYIEPFLWTKETTTAGFILGFKVLTGSIFGSVTADINILPRNADDKDNVSINTTVQSEQTTIDTGFTNQSFSLRKSVINANTGLGANPGSYRLDIAGNTRTSGSLSLVGTLQSYSGAFNVKNIAQDQDLNLQVNDGGTNTTALTVQGTTANVGIGTTSPDAKLQVTGADITGTTPGVSGDNYFSGGTGDTNYLEFSTFNTTSSNAGHRINVSNSAGALYLGVNASDVLVLAANGNVGIGTISPDRALEVDFTGNTVGARFTRSDTTGSSTIEFANSAGVKSTIGFNAGTNKFDIKHNAAVRLSVDNNGAVTFNEAFTFPTTDGTSGQVLKTNGSGTITWADETGGGGSSTSIIDTDLDTKIQVEESADEDVIRFDVAGSEIATMTDDGVILNDGYNFEGDVIGAIKFKAQAGEALTKGDVVYISGISGNTTVVSKADANDSAKMPAFGLAASTVSLNAAVEIVTFGTLLGIDTSTPNYSEGDELYVSTTAGELTDVPPTGSSSLLQKIAKVTRVDASAGSVKVSGAGRTNATPNLDEGRLFVGNSSNQSVQSDDTLYVDMANSRVGINTTNPSQALSVDGNIYSIGGFVNASAYQLNGTYIVDSSRNLVNIAAITTSGNVTVGGDLTVQGTTTTLNTATLDVEDKNITLNYSTGDSSASADGAGITIQDAVNSTTDATLLWAATPDAWQFSHRLYAPNYVVSDTNAVIYRNSNDLELKTYAGYDINLMPAGNVGIGTTSPAQLLDVDGTARFGTSTYRITLQGNSTGGYFKIGTTSNDDSLANFGAFSSSFVFDTTQTNGFVFRHNGSEKMRINSSGNVGIGNTAPLAKFQVEEYGIDTTETSTTATTQVAIHTFAATDFRSARFTIQASNSTDSTYHISEILLVHDGTTPTITEYGTIFTGSAAEATFDADISSGNVRLLATPASTDSIEFKVICHSVTV